MIKTYHARRWTGTRFTATACGAPSFVDYGTTNAAKATCAACIALIAPVIAPEPIARKVSAQAGFEFGAQGQMFVAPMVKPAQVGMEFSL